MMSKIFLKDIITKRIIKMYIIGIILFYLLLEGDLGKLINPIISARNLIWITMLVIGTSTAYIIHTYSLFDKVKLYISLPINKKRFILSFIFSLIIVALLERVSFISIVVFMYCDNPLVNILLIIITSVLCIEINIWGLMLLNENKKFEFVYILFILGCFLVTITLNFSKLNQIIVLILLTIISLIGILKEESLGIAIIRRNSSLFTKFGFMGNYFLKVFIYDKIYLINTILIFIFIIMLSLTIKDNAIIWSLVWVIGSINTPALTMLSSDLSIRKQAEMLPPNVNDIYTMYRRFLRLYFIGTNLFILLLMLFLDTGHIYLNISIFIILSILEPLIAYLLELKIPLLKWQTKQQLWKNPRKYIIALFMFILISIMGMLFW